MSRWIDEFNNHAFQTSWKDLKDKLDETEIGEASATDIEELARLKKAIAFLDGAIESIDPELIQIASLNSFNQQASACRDQINSYSSNSNIGHIRNANDNADNLLAYVRPYLIYPDKIKKSLLSAIRAYTKEMDKHLENITDTQGEYNKVQEYRAEIEAFYNTLFENDKESVESQIAYLLEESEEKYEKINTFYNETLIDDDTESIKTSIDEVKKDILRDSKEANEKLVEVSGKVEELDKFYIKIFGAMNDDDKRVGGLEKELKQRIEALESFKVEQENVYDKEMKSRLLSLKKYEEEQQSNNKNLYEQIESLLPGATSAGLAKAYQVMKESFEDPIKNWNKVFVGSVVIMFVATFLSFVEIGIEKDNVWTWFAFAKMGDFTSTMNSLLFKLPLYAPLVWLAIFASKRRSENQRLQQEYAHKEAMAKSYVSYKMQIDELKQTDNKLLEKLLDSSIDTVSHNASESLDKNHGDQTPVQETIKMFVEQVAKLKG